jgi:hypothetical protein
MYHFIGAISTLEKPWLRQLLPLIREGARRAEGLIYKKDFMISQLNEIL